MSLRFGDVLFEHVRYTRSSGGLAVRRHDEIPPARHQTESREGWFVAYDADGDLNALDIWGALAQLEQTGEITVTLHDGTVLRSPDAADYIREQEAQAAA